MKRRKTHRFRAASLIEAVVSLVLISIVLFIGLAVYGQFYRAQRSIPLALLKELDALSARTIENPLIGEHTLLLTDGAPVQLSLTPYNADSTLLLRVVTTQPADGKPVVSVQRIILAP